MIVSEKTYNEFWKEHEKAYNVWVDGKEVNDHWLTYKEASDLADECVKNGQSPIIGNRD